LSGRASGSCWVVGWRWSSAYLFILLRVLVRSKYLALDIRMYREAARRLVQRTRTVPAVGVPSVRTGRSYCTYLVVLCWTRTYLLRGLRRPSWPGNEVLRTYLPTQQYVRVRTRYRVGLLVVQHGNRELPVPGRYLVPVPAGKEPCNLRRRSTATTRPQPGHNNHKTKDHSIRETRTARINIATWKAETRVLESPFDDDVVQRPLPREWNTKC
jgi:hypothetical protein